MAIDMDDLKRATMGDPNVKVAVSKRWLKEVHQLLARAETEQRLSGLAEKLMGVGGHPFH